MSTEEEVGAAVDEAMIVGLLNMLVEPRVRACKILIDNLTDGCIEGLDHDLPKVVITAQLVKSLRAIDQLRLTEVLATAIMERAEGIIRSRP